MNLPITFHTENQNNNHRLCITVLGYNNIHDTVNCLESIAKLEGGQYPVLYVDNGSEDNSSDYVEKKFPEVNVLRFSSNVGFSTGTNKGLEWVRRQGYDYCLILNNDTIVDKGMVKELILLLDQHKDCAVVMPRIYYYPSKVGKTSRKNIWSDGGYYRNFPPVIKLKDDRRHINYDIPRPIEFAPGCALLLRCSALDSIGLFDENFFLFYEDWDFSIRVKRAGFSIWCAPQAILHHKVSRSTKKNLYIYWKHMGASLFLFYSKHFDRQEALYHVRFTVLRDFLLKPKNLKYLNTFLHGVKSTVE